MFSHSQHHWHKREDKGERKSLPYCTPQTKQTKKGGLCKQGFPRKVASLERQCARVVCRGVASELNLKTSGTRNMLGSISSARTDEWFAPTSAILSCVCRSNTNVQCPYRLPITEATHDPWCQRPHCIKACNNKQICRNTQKAMKQMSGYFGGYIQKKQKIGQY